MFIALKNNKIIAIADLEWECRMKAKGLSPSEYWPWLETVTTENVPDYSGEDYDIHECEGNFESWFAKGLIVPQIADVTLYHLKWDASKKEIVKDDTAIDAYALAEEWKRIREQRTRLLAETDWVVIKARENGGQVPAAWKTYRVALRDVPSEQSSKTKYSEITWPTRPE